MNSLSNKKTKFIDLGLSDYKTTWDYQVELFEETLAIKTQNRNTADQKPTDNFLIFCEHSHVFTLGKSGDIKNLLVQQQNLSDIQASYYHINRGGDITYHGPGQLVVYPILDLENFFTDIHKYMRMLEEAVIQTCAYFNLQAERIPGLTGVWLDAADRAKTRKISAFGVKTSRWVTMHGLAFNVNVDLSYFEKIIPCGIQDKAVTSLHNELGKDIPMDLVKNLMKKNIVTLFEMELYD